MAGGGGAEEEVPGGVLRPFFRPIRWKMGSVLRSSAEKVEDARILRSSEEESHLPLLPSDLRPILRSRRSKMGGFFGLRLRRSKIEDGGVLRSSGPKMEDGGKFFDFRLRRTKMGWCLRSSAPKIEG